MIQFRIRLLMNPNIAHLQMNADSYVIRTNMSESILCLNEISGIMLH